MNTSVLEKALSEGSLKLYEAGQEEGRSSWRLSASGDCPRKLALLELGHEKKKIDGKTARIFSLGTKRGAELAAALELGLEGQGKCLMEPEVALDCGLSAAHEPQQVLGHLDLVHIAKDDGPVTVVEFKTMNEWAWKKVDKGDYNTINENYQYQLATYVLALKEDMPGATFGDAFFVLENKNNGLLKVVRFPINNALDKGETARNRWMFLFRRKDENTLDSVEPGYGPGKNGALPWQCNYCSVAKVCRPDMTNQGTEDKPKWFIG